MHEQAPEPSQDPNQQPGMNQEQWQPHTGGPEPSIDLNIPGLQETAEQRADRISAANEAVAAAHATQTAQDEQTEREPYQLQTDLRRPTTGKRHARKFLGFGRKSRGEMYTSDSNYVQHNDAGVLIHNLTSGRSIVGSTWESMGSIYKVHHAESDHSFNISVEDSLTGVMKYSPMLKDEVAGRLKIAQGLEMETISALSAIIEHDDDTLPYDFFKDADLNDFAGNSQEKRILANLSAKGVILKAADGVSWKKTPSSKRAFLDKASGSIKTIESGPRETLLKSGLDLLASVSSRKYDGVSRYKAVLKDMVSQGDAVTGFAWSMPSTPGIGMATAQIEQCTENGDYVVRIKDPMGPDELGNYSYVTIDRTYTQHQIVEMIDGNTGHLLTPDVQTRIREVTKNYEDLQKQRVTLATERLRLQQERDSRRQPQQYQQIGGRRRNARRTPEEARLRAIEDAQDN